MRTPRQAPASSPLALVLIAVPSCGASERAASSPDASAGGRRKLRAEAGRQVRKPGLRDRGSGAPAAALRRRAARPDTGAAQRAPARRSPFLDISDLVSFEGERGLLSAAFPPDYRQQRAFLRLLHRQRGQHQRIDEFQRAARRLAPHPGRAATVIEIPHPVNANHNGGQLQFLGDLLYFGTGDGGSGGDPPNNAQNLDSPARQAAADRPAPLRWASAYTVPASNPFVGRSGATRSTATGSATPSASPSTPGPRGAADRDRRRRPEPLRGARLHEVVRCSRRQLRLGRLRGLLQIHRRQQRHPGPRRHDQTDHGLPAPERRQLLDHRRLRRHRPRAALSAAAATCTPTSARDSCAASSRT